MMCEKILASVVTFKGFDVNYDTLTPVTKIICSNKISMPCSYGRFVFLTFWRSDLILSYKSHI